MRFDTGAIVCLEDQKLALFIRDCLDSYSWDLEAKGSLLDWKFTLTPQVSSDSNQTAYIVCFCMQFLFREYSNIQNIHIYHHKLSFYNTGFKSDSL